MTEEFKTEEVQAEENKVICSTRNSLVKCIITYVALWIVLVALGVGIMILGPAFVAGPSGASGSNAEILLIATGIFSAFGVFVLFMAGLAFVAAIFDIICIVVSRATIMTNRICGRTLFRSFDVPLEYVTSITTKRESLCIKITVPEGKKKKYTMNYKSNAGEFQTAYAKAIADLAVAKSKASEDVASNNLV